MLEAHLVHDVHLVDLQDHHLILRLTSKAPSDFTQRLGKILNHATGAIWKIEISSEIGQLTLGELRAIARQKRIEDAKSLPLVSQALKLFPGAHIDDVIEMEN